MRCCGSGSRLGQSTQLHVQACRPSSRAFTCLSLKPGLKPIAPGTLHRRALGPRDCETHRTRPSVQSLTQPESRNLFFGGFSRRPVTVPTRLPRGAAQGFVKACEGCMLQPPDEKVSKRGKTEESPCSGHSSQRHGSESSGRVFSVQMKRRASQVKQGDGDCHPVSHCVFGGTPILGGRSVLIHNCSLRYPCPECFRGEARDGWVVCWDRGGAPSLSPPPAHP